MTAMTAMTGTTGMTGVIGMTVMTVMTRRTGKTGRIGMTVTGTESPMKEDKGCACWEKGMFSEKWSAAAQMTFLRRNHEVNE